jgi:hypothetical protein
MGAFMKEDDIFIGTFIDLFNVRFGAKQAERELSDGGVIEMAALQREFDIFKTGRPFVDSARVLGLGGFHNNRAKNRWFKLLDNLKNLKSNKDGENGDQRIVNALIANFGSKAPLPCFMKGHDLRDKKQYGSIVVVTERDRPYFYIDQEYLTISLPMKPRPK